MHERRTVNHRRWCRTCQILFCIFFLQNCLHNLISGSQILASNMLYIQKLMVDFWRKSVIFPTDFTQNRIKSGTVFALLWRKSCPKYTCVSIFRQKVLFQTDIHLKCNIFSAKLKFLEQYLIFFHKSGILHQCADCLIPAQQIIHGKSMLRYQHQNPFIRKLIEMLLNLF